MSFVKDPEAVIDYVMDWTFYLAGNTISTSVWSVPGLTITSQSHTSTRATVWLAGGTAYQRYIARNTITTSAGQTDVRGIAITVYPRNQ